MNREVRRARRLAFGPFVLDGCDERLIGPGGPVRLGRRAIEVLLALVDQPGRLVTKEALFATVWAGTFVSESSLTTAIRELRRALGDESRKPRYIESVYGRGYRFIADVTSEDARLAASPALIASVATTRPASPRPAFLTLRNWGVAFTALLAPMAVSGSSSRPAPPAPQQHAEATLPAGPCHGHDASERATKHDRSDARPRGDCGRHLGSHRPKNGHSRDHHRG